MFNARGRDPKPMAVAKAKYERHTYNEPPKPQEIGLVITDPTTGKVYKRGRFLGKGGFAKCYELIDEATNKVYAGKIVSKSVLVKPHQKEKMSLEISIHRSIHHEHIVGFHGFFEDSNFVYVLLELCRRRSMMELHKRRRVLTEPEVKYYMRQIVHGCQYLHGTKIIHRDLKLGNLFLNDDMQIKIGDFGLATKLDDIGERKKTLCGTPNYIAPEVLGKKGHSFEVDVWSLGCILFTLLVGKPPFETSCLKDTYMRIKHNDYIIPSRISQSAQEVIMKLLQPDPSKRPTMHQVLEFPFFKTGYIPSKLPISCLTTAPRFAVTDRQSLGVGRKPLLELNAKEVALAGMTTANKDRRVSHAVHVCDGVSTLMGPQEMAARGIKDDEEDKDPEDCWLSELHALLAPWKKHAVPEPKIIEEKDFDEAAEEPALTPVYWVSKWVDYTDKYGLGYQLCDNSFGVLYNDETRLILAEDGENFQYIGRDGTENFYTMENLPKENDDVQKKVKLLVHFRDYMNRHLLKAGGNRARRDGDESTRLPFLTAWFRTKYAMVLHLTNGILQINVFDDHTKIILCPRMGAVTYIDAHKNFRTFSLKKIARNGCCEALATRLRYARGMVERLQNPSGPSGKTTSGASRAGSVRPGVAPGMAAQASGVASKANLPVKRTATA